jgi:hypothetical protein
VDGRPLRVGADNPSDAIQLSPLAGGTAHTVLLAENRGAITIVGRAHPNRQAPLGAAGSDQEALLPPAPRLRIQAGTTCALIAYSFSDWPSEPSRRPAALMVGVNPLDPRHTVETREYPSPGPRGRVLAALRGRGRHILYVYAVSAANWQSRTVQAVLAR